MQGDAIGFGSGSAGVPTSATTPTALASPFLDPPIAVLGVDFTSRPCPRKPITVAVGVLRRAQPAGSHGSATAAAAAFCSSNHSTSPQAFPSTFTTTTLDAKPPLPPSPQSQSQSLFVSRVDRIPSLAAFQTWLLAQPGPLVAALDFPFGQPRQLVTALGWGPDWRDLVGTATALSREDFEGALKGFMARQPPGQKHLKRAVAAYSREVSPMSLVRTPTAKMFQAGAPILAAAADAGFLVVPPSGSPAAGQQARDAVDAPPVPVSEPEPAAAEITAPAEANAGAVRGGVAAVAPVRVLVEAYPALPARRVLAAWQEPKGRSGKSGGGGSGNGGSETGGGGGGGGGRVVSYKSDARDKAADGQRARARRAICRALVGRLGDDGFAGGSAEDPEGREEDSDGSPAGCSAEPQQERDKLSAAGSEACGAYGPPRPPALLLPALYGLAEVSLAPEVLSLCQQDGSGDTLDAVLAAVQAAWAAGCGSARNWGAPEDADPLEGWIADPWVMDQHEAAPSEGRAGMRDAVKRREDSLGAVDKEGTRWDKGGAGGGCKPDDGLQLRRRKR